MAENKKSVLLYCDIIHTVEQLDDADAGLLFKHYLRYINDQNPEPPSKLIKIVFEPIKQNLKRDLKTWKLKIKKRSDAGKKGMASRWDNITNDNNVIKPITNITDTVTDTVTVKVIDTVKESNTPLTYFPIEECLKISMRDPRWVKSNKATEKELNEFNGLLEKRGIYEKNPADYKQHFANWKSGGKKDIGKNNYQQQSSAAPLKIVL